MNQKDRLMALLRYRGEQGVTPLDALNEIGCFRLAARVHELRLEGYLIIAHTMKVNGKHYSRYVLEEPASLGQIGMEQIVGWQA